MRIISGALKGKKIIFIKNLITRPLKDSVKENIFNILNHSKWIKTKVKNSNILDLYSGIGSFGIECISRDAKKVVFVEQDKSAIRILNDNLINLSIIDKSSIFNLSIENYFLKEIKEKFNIFFFDPPFANTNFFQNLQSIKKKKIFAKNHIVIIHRDSKTEDNIQEHLEVVELKKYGRSTIIFGIFN